MSDKSEFGLIGLGVMGKSLAQNIAGKDIRLSVYNRHVPGKEEFIARDFVAQHAQWTNIKGFDDIKPFIDSLQKPRKILLMINAGQAVDIVIETLLPHLDKGDIIIDGGNSHYKDTSSRAMALESKGMYFIGTGISGGEEGALKGPSMMPGGNRKAYEHVGKYLEMISAKDKAGKPCCTYIGPQGAGHFVKMVHNGIEYAEMQIVAEIYHLLRYHAQVEPEAIAATFQSWKEEGFSSYILEITIDILKTKEDGNILLDKIVDAAKQKNTGGWTVEAAFELGVPLNTISEAVMARLLSSKKTERVSAMEIYQNGKSASTPEKLSFADFTEQLKNTYEASRIVNHAIGFDLLERASAEYDWDLNLSEIARIWTNGCIIRSTLMERLVKILTKKVPVLQHPDIVNQMKNAVKDLSKSVSAGLLNGHPLPVLSASLNYFLSYTSGQSPANLIQAQRDYFGAHTYQRVDKPLTEHFHTEWK